MAQFHVQGVWDSRGSWEERRTSWDSSGYETEEMGREEAHFDDDISAENLKQSITLVAISQTGYIVYLSLPPLLPQC